MNSRSSARSWRIAAISSSGLNQPASARATASESRTVVYALAAAARKDRWQPSCPMRMSLSAAAQMAASDW